MFFEYYVSYIITINRDAQYYVSYIITINRDDAVLRLKRIWLDKMGITKIENLEMLGNITHIHLDFNSISFVEVNKIYMQITPMLLDLNHIILTISLYKNTYCLFQNLETLGPSLQHLSLRGNNISVIGEGLVCLSKLMSLDLSDNKISKLSTK